jgi:hypothetical protein
MKLLEGLHNKGFRFLDLLPQLIAEWAEWHMVLRNAHYRSALLQMGLPYNQLHPQVHNQVCNPLAHIYGRYRRNDNDSLTNS